MILYHHSILTIVCAYILLPISSLCQASSDLPLERIKLPPGFVISVYARAENARSLSFGDNGTLFVGTRTEGKVYAIPDQNHDGSAGHVFVIAEGLNMPNGVAFRDGALYVAEVNRILRFDDIEARLANPPRPVVINESYPRDRHHGWKYLRFGLDGWLYVPVGAPCNVCDPKPEGIYAVITRIRPDGSGRQVIAQGIRNTVGFDWHPKTGDLWFTDNGRDNLGDDVPNDEVNHVTRTEMHFGFPYCHGGDIPDPDYGWSNACADFTPPAMKIGAHHAPLGLRFYTGRQFPAEYRNAMFIAEHGSWNRSSKVGYRVIVAQPDQGGHMRSRVFADGWLAGDNAWGRPVDLIVDKDGSLLVSDDKAGAIYRISYIGKQK